ncbi:hypothetical protein HKX48_002094 [Thoreauomyces humboldtii]|nr:hypothetical protein HKX48_002094 [Thoreauomyces humboldtii]
MFCNIVAPIVLYYVVKEYTSLIAAILISSIPPVVYAVYTFLLDRRLEFTGCIIILSFVATLIVAKATDNVRILLLKDSIVMLFMGSCFLFTLLPIRTKDGERRRPLIFTMAAKSDPERQETLWTTLPWFRSLLTTLTWLWGLGMTAEFAAKLVVVLVIEDVNTATDVSNVMTYAVLGGLVVLNYLITAVVVLRHRGEIKVADATDNDDGDGRGVNVQEV